MIFSAPLHADTGAHSAKAGFGHTRDHHVHPIPVIPAHRKSLSWRRASGSPTWHSKLAQGGHAQTRSSDSDALLQSGHAVGLHNGLGRLGLHYHHLPEDLTLARLRSRLEA